MNKKGLHVTLQPIIQSVKQNDLPVGPFKEKEERRPPQTLIVWGLRVEPRSSGTGGLQKEKIAITVLVQRP